MEKPAIALSPMDSRPQREPVPTLASEQVESDPKRFFLDLKENARGRVYRITEETRGRRNTIMLPAGAAKEFVEAMSRLVEFEGKL